jgi:hypothetical protein
MISLTEAYESYNDMLDESGTIIIGGVGFYPSTILKEMDPTAYNTGFNDYMDAVGIDTDDLMNSDYEDTMDGDFDSAMASAGFGTDEDYGYYGNYDD